LTIQVMAPTAIAASTNFTGAVTDVDEAIDTIPVNFNGSTYLIRGGGLTNLADSKILLISVFFRAAGGAGVERRIMTIRSGATASRLTIGLDTANKFFILARDAAPVGACQVTSSMAFAAGAAWHHALLSFDLNNSANRGLYMDGVVDPSPNWAVYANSAMDLAPTSPEIVLGAYENTPSLTWNGDVANLFLHAPAAYVAPATVLAAFIDANGVPVDMGIDGSLPLGLQPVLCMSRKWPANDGSGGNFTVGAGTLGLGTGPVDV